MKATGKKFEMPTVETISKKDVDKYIEAYAYSGSTCTGWTR